MERECESLDQIRRWGRDMHDGIAQVQATAYHEKNLLQLHLETHPLPFQPSPVLVQLIQNNRRRGNSSVLITSAKQRKQQLKSADYLDRKFESEIRQHYELENAGNCARWKRFHAEATEARRQLAAGMESDYRRFCRQLGAPYNADLNCHGSGECDNQLGFEPSPTASTVSTNSVPAGSSIEDTLRLHLAQEWVRQERFNLQEAFTNQMRKLQDDLDAYLREQDAYFIDERQKVLNASVQELHQPEKGSVLKKNQRLETKPQFQSSTKRSMLVHTAPPLAIEPNVDEEERLVQSRATSVEKSRSRRTRSDVSETQQKLDNLQKRLQVRKDAAEAKRKDGMQWIGRQCANMFTQLDCKETEAKVVALLVDEDLTQTGALHRRVSEIVDVLEKHCQQLQPLLKSTVGQSLQPSSSSETRLPQVSKK